jgi:hypothetical protein
MRTSAAALGLAALLIGVPSATADPDQDLVAGAVKGLTPTPLGSFPSHIHANAKGNALEGKGHFFARFDTPLAADVSGTVLCVDAIGNEAIYLGRIDKSTTPAAPVGTLIWRKIVDNGEGASDPPDETGVVLASGPFCPPATSPIPTSPVDQGNFTVHDGV